MSVDAVAAPRSVPWKPVVLDLAQPLTDIPMEGADRLHITALRGEQVFGSFLLSAPLDPMPAMLVRDGLLRHLGHELAAPPTTRLIPQRGGAVPAAVPTVAVMVCTRDRPDDLERCLASIAKLQPAVDEVVVVDNGSRTPQTRQVAEAAGVHYVHEPAPGLDRARNRGVQTTTAQVLLCTDDDVEVDQHWGTRLLACFQDPLVMGATGLVLPARLDTVSRQLFETHAGFSRGPRRRVLDGTIVPATAAGSIGAGASMAFRTDFLRWVGGFPEELDAGMPTQSGGDHYMVYRLLRAGFRIVYDPSALVFHHHRDDPAELHRALSGYGTGALSYLTYATLHDRDPAAAVSAARWAARRMVVDPARTLLRRPGAVPLELLAAEAGGMLRTARAYPAARRVVAGRTPVIEAPAALIPALPAVLTPALSAGAPVTTRVTQELPTITVVVPSRGRRGQVTGLLRALDNQDYAEGRVDTVVVLDGDLDGSAAAIGAMDLRRPARVLTLQPPDATRGNGAAVARNAGAEVATGSVLLFLDDDVEPASDQVLLAHATAHRDFPDGGLALVGPCPPKHWDVDGRHAKRVRNWWVDHAYQPAGQPLGFADVLTGNLSCSRRDFQALGGFLALPRREDWEFGHRLLASGVRLQAAPGAAVWHDADLDLGSALGDRVSEGAGDAAFARARPGVAGLLPLGAWWTASSRAQVLRAAVFRAYDRRLRSMALATSVRLLDGLETAHWQRGWRALDHRAATLAYFSGVADVLTQAELMALLMSTQQDEPLFELDLDDVPSALPILPPLRDGSVMATVGGVPLGLGSIAWGGTPWRQETFLDRFLSVFGERADELRARRLSS